MHIAPPIFNKDRTVQVSLSGITKIKEYKLNNSLPGLKDFSYNDVAGLHPKTKLNSDAKKKTKPKYIPAFTEERPFIDFYGNPIIIPATPKPAKKAKAFTINKTQVTHRIRNFCNQMSGEKKLFFWTVTFPAHTPDDTCFTLFNIWLTRLRKELNLRSYLWVTERQTGERHTTSTQVATNTLHFHITFHQRICVKKANKFMRAAIFNAVEKGLINFNRKSAKNYNGVDIAKDRKTKRVINFASQKKQKSLANYLTKYVTKNKGTFHRLAWHCSRDYSNLVIKINLSYVALSFYELNNYASDTALFDNQFFEFLPWLTGPPPLILESLAKINRCIVSVINNEVTN